MDVNEARVRTEEDAKAFAARQVSNGYDVVQIAYDDRPKYVSWGRCWLVIYG